MNDNSLVCAGEHVKKIINQTRRVKAQVVTALNYVTYVKAVSGGGDDGDGAGDGKKSMKKAAKTAGEDVDMDDASPKSAAGAGNRGAARKVRIHEIAVGFSDGTILSYMVQTTTQSLKAAWKVKKDPPVEMVWRPMNDKDRL